MKKTAGYKILHFNFMELYSNANIQESDHSLILSSDDLKDILLSKIPYYLRGSLSHDPSVRELAENAAVNIPENAILRIMRSRQHSDEKNPFLYSLIYVDIGRTPEKNQIEHLVNGLTLCLSEDEEDRICFVPFERSASQTRNNQLVMIDRKMKTDALEQAIRCGTGENVKVNPAKWAAYRALLLSSGVTVDHAEAGIELNEKTVIVVPDYTYENLIKAQTAILKKSDVSDPVVSTTSGKGKETKHIKNDILFDGEGLISASWALKIAEQIIDPKESVKPEDISSFQIRLPFTKGLLHKVDFHALFREIFGDEQELYIRDLYNEPRELSNVQIILSKSMFKAGSVICDSESYANFWKSFQTQNHRLYITNCDVGMTNSEQRQTIANYQFFSTLDFGEKQELAKDIIRPAMAAVLTAANSQDSTVISYLMRAKKDLAAEDDFVEDEAADTAAAEPDEITDAMLLQKCPELARNTVFSGIMSKLSMLDSCSIGRLYTAGSLLYLSGDLVQMVLLLAKKIADMDGKPDKYPELLGKLCEETMRPDNGGQKSSAFYYAPGVPALPCILDRNPHLSRQEHVYAEPIQAGAFRKKYFSHLKGVCMVRHDIAYAAQRLGGADYDGDLVRLFYDPYYIAAAKGGMELPALCIPSQGGTKTAFDDKARKKMLLDSAQNRVGLFSNAGFYSSLFSYQYRRSQPTADMPDSNTSIAEEAEKNIVQLSVITGHEIDAAKTGVKPVYNPSDFVFAQHKKGSNDPYQLGFFIRFKEMMKGSRHTPVDMYSLKPKEDTSLGEYSPVEVLPYIFRPSLVTLKTSASDILPDWSRICRQILWDEKKGKFSLHISEETAIKYSKAHLHDLITSGGSQAFSEEQTAAVREAVAAVQTFWSLCQFNLESSENSYYLNCMQRKLYQICGLKQSKEYIRILEKFSEHFHDPEKLLSDFFRIVPWRNLENSWLRYRRFSMKLLRQYQFPHENVKEFEKLFDLRNTDSVETDNAPTGTKESIDLIPAVLRASLTQAQKSGAGGKTAFLKSCGPVIDAIYQGAKQKEIKQLAWKFCQDVIQPLMQEHPDAPKKLAVWIETCDCDPDQKNWVTMSQTERIQFIQNHFALEQEDSDTQKALALLTDPKCWSLLPYFMRYCIVTSEKHRRSDCQKKLRKYIRNFFCNILKKDTIREGSPISKEEFMLFAKLILEQCGGDANAESSDMQQIFDFDEIIPDTEHQSFIIRKRNKNGIYDQSGRVSARSLLWFGLLYCLKTDAFSAVEKIRSLFLAVTGKNDHETFLRILLELTREKDQCQKIGFKDEKERDEFVFRFYKKELYRILKQSPSAYKPVNLNIPPDVGYLDGRQGYCIESSLEKRQDQRQDQRPDETPEITIKTIVSDKLPEDLLETIRQAVEAKSTASAPYKLTVLPKDLNEDEKNLIYERLRVQRLAALPFIIKHGEQEVLHGYVTYLWLPECLKDKILPVEGTVKTMPVNRRSSIKQDSQPLPYFLYGYKMFERNFTQVKSR